MLSVSGLLLVIPLVYIRRTGPLYIPVTSAFAGIASFLSHAATTRTTSILDYIAFNTLAAGILADLFTWHKDWRTGAAVFSALLTTTILVRLLVDDKFPNTNEDLNTYTYVIQSILFVAILVTSDRFSYEPEWSGGLFLIGGAIALIVGNAVDSLWGCIETQFAGPHFWGHFLVAVGLTLYARAMGNDNGEYKILR